MANPAPEPQAALPIKNKPTQTEPPPATPDKDKPLSEKEEVPEEEKKPSRFNPLNWFKDKPKSKDQDPEASLLAGILFGVDTGLTTRLQDAFKNTGTAHIITISGFNIV